MNSGVIRLRMPVDQRSPLMYNNNVAFLDEAKFPKWSNDESDIINWQPFGRSVSKRIKNTRYLP